MCDLFHIKSSVHTGNTSFHTLFDRILFFEVNFDFNYCNEIEIQNDLLFIFVNMLYFYNLSKILNSENHSAF